MKKVFIIPAAIFAVLFIISAIKLSYPAKTQENNEISSLSRKSEPMYVLKEHNGTVAVFTPNSATPERELPEIVLNSLPEYDKNLLKTGIKVYSDKELQRLIEDYDSWAIALFNMLSESCAIK